MKVLMLVGLMTLMHVATAALPKYFVPIAYNLSIIASVDNASITTFDGNVALTFNTTADLPVDTRNVTLHSSGLTLTDILFSYPSTRRDQISTKSVVVDKKEQTITVTVLESLKPLRQYTLNISYTGLIREDYGLARVKSGSSYYLTTRLYPTYSRLLYPCMDEPGRRASYNLTLNMTQTIMKKPVFVTGIPLVALGGKAPTFYEFYKSSNPLPPYGVFFSIGAYTQPTSPDVVYRPENLDSKSVSESLNLALQTDTIKSLIGTTDSKNPTMKVVIVPGLQVPSESTQGIVALSYDLVTAKELTTIGNLTQAHSTITALVKSAYGGIVSPAEWKDVWVSESVSAYIAKEVLKEITSWNIKDVDHVLNPLELSWSEKSSPVVSDLKTVDDIIKYFSDMEAINKGAAIVGMMESLLGSGEKQLAALINIVKENMSKGIVVSSNDFLTLYQNHTKLDANLPTDKRILADLITPWLEQTGYPTLIVTRKSKDITASQVRFGYPENKNSTNTRWYIPIYSNFWTTAVNTTNDLKWLSPGDNDDLTLHQNADDKSTIAANTKGSGLYRVLYDDIDLNNTNQLLVADLTTLSPDARAAFVSNSLVFAKRNQIKYSVALQSLNFLNNEDSYLPWMAAVSGFDDLWNLVYNSDLLRLFQNYATDRMRKTFNQYKDVTAIDKGKPTSAIVRKLIVGAQCKFQDFNCKEVAKNNFVETLPTNTYGSVACSVYYDEKNSTVITEALKAKYEQDASIYTKQDVFSYLACPLLNTTLNLYLVEVLRTVQNADLPIAFEAAYSKPYNLATSIKFFSDNYGTFSAKLTTWQIVKIINDFGTKGVTDQHIALLQALKYGNDTNIAAAVKASLDTMKSRKQFLSDNYDELYAGLTGYQPPTPSPNTPTPTPNPTGSPTPSGPTQSTTTEKQNSAFGLSPSTLLLLVAGLLSFASLR